MKKVALLLVLAMAASLTIGCGNGVKVWRPEGSPGYIDMQGKRFLVMPVDMRYVEGDKTAMAGALFGGFIAEFGDTGIPMQPVQPALEKVGLGDLGYKLARGLTHAAFVHNSSVWDACGGEDYSVVPKMTKTLVEKVAEILGKPEVKFDYIVVLHIDTLGAGSLPKTTKLRVLGGMYDPMKDEIAVAVKWDQTTAEDVLLAEMATIGPKAIGIMAGKSPKKEEGGDEKAEEAPEKTEEAPEETEEAPEKTEEGGE